MSVLAMQNRAVTSLPAEDVNAFRQSPYACQGGAEEVSDGLYEDLYGEAVGASKEQEAEAEAEEGSDAERAMFVKSDCLKGAKAHVLETDWRGRLSSANISSNSAPGTPVGFNQSQTDTWRTNADTRQVSRSEAGTPRGHSGRGYHCGEDGEDGETVGHSLNASKAERAKAMPSSHLKPAVAREQLELEPTLSKGLRVLEKLRTEEASEKDSGPLSAGSTRTLAKRCSRTHSLSIPEDSSSSSSTPQGTPKGVPKGGHGHRRLRSMDMSRLDKSLACEILFGEEDIDHRSLLASPRMSKKKTMDRGRGREHRAHTKSPLMAECHGKGGRSLGHSTLGDEAQAKSAAKSRARDRNASSAHCHSAGSRSMGHEEGRKREVLKGRQVSNILDGEGSDQDDNCRIDDFDPVDSYLPYLGVGEAVYDKISGCKSK